MYVESSKCCNELAFKLGSGAGTSGGNTVATRQWQIKVTQYSCDYNNLAPQGCVQYYFGQTTQQVWKNVYELFFFVHKVYLQVQTYNYDNGNGRHLANQDQQVCVRCYVVQYNRKLTHTILEQLN